MQSSPRAQLERSFESDSLASFHAAHVRERLAPSGLRLPEAYAATLSPLAIEIAGSGEVCTFSILGGRVALTPGAERAGTTIELARASDVLHVAPPPTGASGPHRSCILIGYTRAGGGHHEGGRHYNDVLLGDESGQIADMRKVAARS